MKKVFIISSILIAFLMAATAFNSKPPFYSVSVIELFTSQGCSSCPPADRLLSKTIAQAKKDGNAVLALSFHVDYWDRLGWKDAFSDSRYSDRQRSYAEKLNLGSVYTPQVIVNGSNEFVGSDKEKMEQAIKASLLEKPAASFTSIEAKFQDNQSPKIFFELKGDYKDCMINIALISLSETTTVKRGENGGATLKSENIVRQFKSVAATAKGEVDLNPSPMPVAGNRAVIAYIQRRSDFKIIGAVQSPIN